MSPSQQEWGDDLRAQTATVFEQGSLHLHAKFFWGVGLLFGFYSSSLYPNVKFSDVTKHPKGFEKGIQ